MAFQIALAWSKETSKELEEMGFRKTEVYIKNAPGVTTEESKKLGDREFFRMKHPPYQFVTTSYWGAGSE